MNFIKVICLIFIVFNSIHSSEDKNLSLTLEGFDNLQLCTGVNMRKIHFNLKLGLGYKRSRYGEVITHKALNTSAGLNFGLLFIPVETVEIIPTLGCNFHIKFDWMEDDPNSDDQVNDVNYTYKWEPNTSITVYKLFNSLIIGGGLNLVLFSFEWIEPYMWNKDFEISIKPHFIIGFRF